MNEEEVIKQIEQVVVSRGRWEGVLPDNITTWIGALYHLEYIATSRGWYIPVENEVQIDRVPVHDCSYGCLDEAGSIFLIALISGKKIKYGKGTRVDVMGWKWDNLPSPHFLQYVKINQGSGANSLYIVGVPNSALRLCYVGPNKKSGKTPCKRKPPRTKEERTKRPRTSPPSLSSLPAAYQARWRLSQVVAESMQQLQVHVVPAHQLQVTEHIHNDLSHCPIPVAEGQSEYASDSSSSPFSLLQDTSSVPSPVSPDGNLDQPPLSLLFSFFANNSSFGTQLDQDPLNTQHADLATFVEDLPPFVDPWDEFIISGHNPTNA